MDPKILHKNVQDFIAENLYTDTSKLLFKYKDFEGVSIKAVVEQIEAKKRCKTKLPTWYNAQGIYFPNKLNIEQTSSERTAAYKAKLVSGESLIDITGGFGVDGLYFAKQVSQVTHVETNAELSAIAKHNASVLDVNNMQFYAQDGIAYLKDSKQDFDWIYIDPSRRHDTKGKVFFLKDCLPNVPEHLDFLFTKTNNILIKTSPLLDITVGLKELIHVSSIHVVSVNNEVKEVLWILKNGYEGDIGMVTMDLNAMGDAKFEFQQSDEDVAEVRFSEPQTYLYEPNAAVMKSGAFKSVASQLNIPKLAINSHLYTSENLIDFPGRRFKIEQVLSGNTKTLKRELPKKANITTRNYPESVQQIRKRLGIKDGGERFVFFTTSHSNDKLALVCSKVL